MSQRPPDDEDPLWSEIVAQVDEALQEAELSDESTRAALLQGVREALSSRIRDRSACAQACAQETCCEGSTTRRLKTPRLPKNY